MHDENYDLEDMELYDIDGIPVTVKGFQATPLTYPIDEDFEAEPHMYGWALNYKHKEVNFYKTLETLLHGYAEIRVITWAMDGCVGENKAFKNMGNAFKEAEHRATRFYRKEFGNG